MTLKEKLLKVMSAVAVLGKDSRNAEIGYDYVSAAKFNAAVSKALRENRIICIPNIHVLKSDVCVEGTFASIEAEITLADADSDETFTIHSAGDGKGKNAMGAAQTMAMKYAWKMAFVVAEKGDDPDSDKTTETTKAKPSDNNSVWIKRY